MSDFQYRRLKALISLDPLHYQVIIDKTTRNKRKCVTTVFGLDNFGVRLGEAAKLFGKKFASGAAVVKSPTEKEQIDIQGDCMDKVGHVSSDVCVMVQVVTAHAVAARKLQGDSMPRVCKLCELECCS